MTAGQRWTTVVDGETARFALKIGGLHLLLAGVANVLTGSILWYLSSTDRFLVAVLRYAGQHVSDVTLVRYAPLAAVLATDATRAVSVVFVFVGLASCVVFRWYVLRRRFQRRCLFIAACNGCNPLAFPLALISVVLVGASQREFPTATEGAPD
jgi:hypothetical protein